jgi:hypothetical protein
MKELSAKVWPIPFGLIFLLLCAGAVFSINPVEWLLAAVVGVLGLREILKLDTIPVHLAFVFPYLEIVTSLADAEVNGSEINEYFYGHGSEVFIFSLIGLCMVYTGWKVRAQKFIAGGVVPLEKSMLSLSLKRLIILYFVFQGLAVVMDVLIPFGSSLKQLEKHITILNLTCFAIILWRYKARQDHRAVFFGFIAYVVVTSLFSFFSAWKGVFIFSAFVMLVRDSVPSVRVLRNFGLLAGIGVVFVLTWQGIKSEYRNFLNQGTRLQRIDVSQSEGLAKFAELTQRFWFEDNSEKEEWYSVGTTEDAFQSSLERLGYLDLFSRMRQYVPSEIPHENGKLLSGNLSFALIPRILNPNKGRKDDQWKVEKYAKRIIADNASFSLGHYAEHYIDFGKYGMLLSLLIFGWAGGWLTQKVMRGKGVMRAVDGAFVFYFLQYFASFQFDAIKIYGLVFWAIVTYLALWRRILERGLGWASVK